MLSTIGYTSEDDPDGSGGDNTLQTSCITRSGRRAGTWRHAMRHLCSETESSSDGGSECSDTSSQNDSDNSSPDSCCDGDDEQPGSVLTRSGRRAGTWRRGMTI